MGTTQSTHINMEISSFDEAKRNVSGRKQSNDEDDDIVIVELEKMMISTDEEASAENSAMALNDDSDDDDEGEDEEWNERLHILEDARTLASFANFFFHPQEPVVSDATACARCYFSRPSAEEQETEDDMDDRDDILEDMKQLKQYAIIYKCPEKPVEVDPLASCRNYFNRASAPQQEDPEEANERVQALSDARALKQLAVDYMHPELPVVSSDPCACGRNYFTRFATEEYNDTDAKECEQILHEMKLLKELAVDYLHPEKPVVTSNPSFVCGRNYFTRFSAQEFDEEDEDERHAIMEDMKQLKQLAVDYLHPEYPVVTSDPFACGRNYFTRPSADVYEEADAMDDCNDILEDTKQLKKLAVDYLHPEKPIEVHPLASCRNFFDRPSAEGLGVEEEEKQLILQEMKQLKELAVDYLHPEKPVITSDPLACGRNYFSRPSAHADESDEEERNLILKEMKQLKQLAVDYLHPEKPVITSDPLACGRNYFTRPSAHADVSDEEERNLILKEMKQLKQLAVDYLHPEKPVTTADPCACGRNYFSRLSAEQQVSLAMAQEQDRMLLDLSQLKQLAVDYLHPERAIMSPAYGARNYFSRASAAGHLEHIHSQGYSIFDDTHSAIYQEEEEEEDHSHSLHFDMDEDIDLQSFKEHLLSTDVFINEYQPKEAAGLEGEEGNLSRSPSCVLLYGL